jgi:hypothetical protein
VTRCGVSPTEEFLMTGVQDAFRFAAETNPSCIEGVGDIMKTAEDRQETTKVDPYLWR